MDLWPPFSGFLDHTHTKTHGRTPLDEWSALRSFTLDYKQLTITFTMLFPVTGVIPPHICTSQKQVTTQRTIRSTN
jgi:hypothetical protein